jgi:hypothetical protein
VRSLLLPLVAAVVVALPTAASGAFSVPSATTTNNQTFQDTTGEDPTAPDITTIVVSNDNAGLITFRINVPNRAQQAQDLGVVMFLDSDSNQATGDPASLGADHIIQYLRGEPILFRWDGSDFSLSATQSTLSAAWSSGATIRINAAQLGNARRLSFDALVVSGLVFDDLGGLECPEATCKRDFAPAVGFYQYEVRIERPTLLVRRVSAGKATAGKPFTLRMRTARSDTGATVQNGRVTCVGRVGNARLRARVQRVIGGWATCTWNLPPDSKGKRFRGSISIAFEGLRASESFASRIG